MAPLYTGEIDDFRVNIQSDDFAAAVIKHVEEAVKPVLPKKPVVTEKDDGSKEILNTDGTTTNVTTEGVATTVMTDGTTKVVDGDTTTVTDSAGSKTVS